MKNIRGLIFDLDGTLVDSQLDFDLMREEMELPPGRILESIAALPEERARRCMAILQRHEVEGAARATVLPGVGLLLEKAAERKVPVGILTRNSRETSLAMLTRLRIEHDVLL